MVVRRVNPLEIRRLWVLLELEEPLHRHCPRNYVHFSASELGVLNLIYLVEVLAVENR
jgi:hypothetical protein